MELNSFEKPGGGASVARPALDRVAAAREGGLDLFDVIIPSRTWRIQDRVSAPPSVSSHKGEFGAPSGSSPQQTNCIG